jgi:hypothetical protein
MANYKDPATIAKGSEAVVKLWHLMDGVYIWQFFTTLDYEWDVIRGHRPYRWTIWVCRFFSEFRHSPTRTRNRESAIGLLPCARDHTFGHNSQHYQFEYYGRNKLSGVLCVPRLARYAFWSGSHF